MITRKAELKDAKELNHLLTLLIRVRNNTTIVLMKNLQLQICMKTI